MRTLLALAFILILSVTFITASFLYLDRLIASFFYYYPFPVLQDVMQLVSYPANPVFVLIFGLAFIIAGIAGNYRNTLLPAHSWIFWGVSIILSFVSVVLLKNIFCRTRPEMFVEEGVYGFAFFCFDGTAHSFPSGHAAMATALALPAMLIFRSPWLNILSLFFIAFIAFSRVVTTEHFLSDVLAAVVLAVTIVFIFYVIFDIFFADNEPEKQEVQEETENDTEHE